MTVSDLLSLPHFSKAALPAPEKNVEGVYIGDLLSWVMGRAGQGSAWITIMSNINVLAVASLADVSCVIFAEGVVPDTEIIALANEKGVNLITSELPAYETAIKLSEL